MRWSFKNVFFSEMPFTLLFQIAKYFLKCRQNPTISPENPFLKSHLAKYVNDIILLLHFWRVFFIMILKNILISHFNLSIIYLSNHKYIPFISMKKYRKILWNFFSWFEVFPSTQKFSNSFILTRIMDPDCLRKNWQGYHMIMA